MVGSPLAAAREVEGFLRINVDTHLLDLIFEGGGLDVLVDVGLGVLLDCLLDHLFCVALGLALRLGHVCLLCEWVQWLWKNVEEGHGGSL